MNFSFVNSSTFVFPLLFWKDELEPDTAALYKHRPGSPPVVILNETLSEDSTLKVMQYFILKFPNALDEPYVMPLSFCELEHFRDWQHKPVLAEYRLVF